jgi:membrane fusion protein (multidrug efflux system)
LAPPDDSPPKKSRLSGFIGHLLRLLSFLVAAAIIYVFFTQWNVWQGEERYQSTTDAYLQTNLTPLAAQVSGYVSRVPVQDYATVVAGQVIAEIVDSDYRARVAQAEAEVSGAEAAIAELAARRPLLEANLAAARAVVAATDANLAQSGRDVARQRRLFRSGSASQADTEKISTTNAELIAQRQQNQAQADAVAQEIKLLDVQERQAEATLAAQRAALRLAEINLGYTRITAPTAGVIGKRQVLPGQYVAPGTQITTLAELPLVWVSANYKETQLTHVAVGDEATVTVDSFPDHVLRGRVVAISPASGSELALLPPDNATGNFTKIVQRITVKIAITDADGLADKLRAGMSAIPSIDTHSTLAMP